MIRARAATASFAAGLAARAARLAAAQVETRLRARREDGRHWRIARLLWPLFARER